MTAQRILAVVGATSLALALAGVWLLRGITRAVEAAADAR